MEVWFESVSTNITSNVFSTDEQDVNIFLDNVSVHTLVVMELSIT